MTPISGERRRQLSYDPKYSSTEQNKYWRESKLKAIHGVPILESRKMELCKMSHSLNCPILPLTHH